MNQTSYTLLNMFKNKKLPETSKKLECETNIFQLLLKEVKSHKVLWEKSA